MIMISPAAQQAWQDACTELAAEIPHYTGKDGKPNLVQLAKAASACADEEQALLGTGRLVTMENVTAVSTAIRARYERKSAEDPGKYPPLAAASPPETEPPGRDPADDVEPDKQQQPVMPAPVDTSFDIVHHLLTDLPEAPASVNFRAFHLATGFQCQFTLRDWDDDQLMARLRKRVLSMIAAGWSGDAPRPAPAVTQPASTGTAPRPAPTTVTPPAVPSTPPQPAAPASPAVPQAFQAVRLEVAPRPDGRVNVLFFGAGRKYADISTVRTPEYLTEMLSLTGDWTPAHFAAPATYDMDVVVEWVASEKLNAQQKPYKNIVRVSPA